MKEAVTQKRLWVVVAMAGIGMARVVGAADAGTPAGGGTRAEVVATLAGVTAALARGDSAEKVSKMLYAQDIVMVEPGGDPAIRGMAGAIAGVEEWMKGAGPGGLKACNYTVIDPVVSSQKTFSSFLELHCKANGTTNKEDMNLRLLYVWEKKHEGWRVVQEAVNEGKF